VFLDNSPGRAKYGSDDGGVSNSIQEASDIKYRVEDDFSGEVVIFEDDWEEAREVSPVAEDVVIQQDGAHEILYSTLLILLDEPPKSAT
jgi:hypothetical protein